MAPSLDRTGVCIVRAWATAEVVVFRVRWRVDVMDAAGEEVVVVTDVEEAVRAVGDFLRSLSPAIWDQRGEPPR